MSAAGWALGPGPLTGPGPRPGSQGHRPTQKQDSTMKTYQKPCVFEDPNAELREGSLISDHRTLNFDRGLKFEPKCRQPAGPWTRAPGKHIKNLVFLSLGWKKHIKNLVFLNVHTPNCVRGRSFQIANRSTSIGVSISSQNVGSRLARPCPACPAVPGFLGHGLPPGTSPPHAPESR